MKRMGENIDSSNFILYENNFKIPFIIEEGLIKSYPIGPVMSFISNAFNFKYLGEKTVFEVDLTKVNETNKFYFDPRVRNALYTYEPISPNALKII